MTAVRLGICLLVAFAVLAHGAVEPWSQSTVEIGAALLVLLWGMVCVCRREIKLRGNWLYLPLLGLTAFAATQRAFGLTAYHWATDLELQKWAAGGLLLFLAVQTFRSKEELKGLVWFLLALGFAVSLFGIIQHFTFNGKLYWFRELRQGGVPFGPYVNRNHFAGFVELIVPLGLAILLSGAIRRDKLPLVALLTLFPIGALVLSGSRGGIVSFVFELLFLAILVPTHAERKRQSLAVAGVALAAILLVVWLGPRQTLARFEMSRPGEVSRDRRVAMLKDTWQVFRHHLWTGTGLGTLEAVYPQYETYYDGLIVDHAHNDYLEMLAELGVLGGVCGLVFIAQLLSLGLTHLRAARSRSLQAFFVGALVACGGILVHSLVDFNLHILSNAVIFLLLAGLACSKAEEPAPAPGYRPRV